MLQVTDGAAEAVKAMLQENDVPAGGGLRITVDESEDAVDLLVEEESSPEDTVIDRGGVKVFLDADAAKALDDKILDAHGHDDHFHFELLEQDGS